MVSNLQRLKNLIYKSVSMFLIYVKRYSSIFNQAQSNESSLHYCILEIKIKRYPFLYGVDYVYDFSPSMLDLKARFIIDMIRLLPIRSSRKTAGGIRRRNKDAWRSWNGRQRVNLQKRADEDSSHILIFTKYHLL